MARYIIPKAHYRALNIWPDQEELRAGLGVVTRYTGGPDLIKFWKTHADPAPAIPQRLVLIRGFLKDPIPLEILADIVGNPIAQGYEDVVRVTAIPPSEHALLTVLPLQKAPSGVWWSTGSLRASGDQGRERFYVKYEDSPSHGPARDRTDIYFTAEGVQPALRANVDGLVTLPPPVPGNTPPDTGKQWPATGGRDPNEQEP